MKLIGRFLFLKRALRQQGLGDNWMCRGENPLPKIRGGLCASWSGKRVDHAPRSFEQRRDGKGKPVLPVGNRGFSLSPFPRVFPYIRNDQRCANIPEDKHGDSQPPGSGSRPRQARIPSSPPPLPRSPPPFYFKLLTYFLKDILKLNRGEGGEK